MLGGGSPRQDEWMITCVHVRLSSFCSVDSMLVIMSQDERNYSLHLKISVILGCVKVNEN
jgi:hypothetical protein